MGMEVGLTLLAAGSVVGTVAQAQAQEAAAAAEQQQLALQQKQQTIQTQQKTLKNYDDLQQLLNAQESVESTRGVASGSPSFNAIQRNSLNSSSQTQTNIDTQNMLQQEGIDYEKQNVQNSLYAQLFGDAMTGVSNVTGIVSKIPTKQV